MQIKVIQMNVNAQTDVPVSTFLFHAMCVVLETTWRHPSSSAKAPQRLLAQQNSSPYGKTEPLFSQPSLFFFFLTQFLKALPCWKQQTGGGTENRGWQNEKSRFSMVRNDEDGKLSKELYTVCVSTWWIVLFTFHADLRCYRLWFNVHFFRQTKPCGNHYSSAAAICLLH